jgi:2-polyprenyl-3-methyl-5-hydroxy-6-metoxy-1,4-benzoquinol methylase
MQYRHLEPEEMDDNGLHPDAHHLALEGLARLNLISFSAPSIWNALQNAGAFGVINSRPTRILDLATGGGDLPVYLGVKAQRLGIPIELTGIDRSSTALASARALADRSGIDVKWDCLDVTRDAIPPADWITCSLFLHHLPDDQVVALIRSMAAAASKGIVVNDLERSYLNRGLVWLGSRLVSRSPVVHRDSDRSVCAGFTMEEITQLLESAGLDGARPERRFPCRFQWTWTKTLR